MLESGGHSHIWNSQPYQLHASTHTLTDQTFSANKKSTTHQIQPKQTPAHEHLYLDQ